MAGKRRANAGSFKPGVSGNPSGKSRRLDAAALARLDEWMNDLTGLGMLGRDKRLGSAQNRQFVSDVVSSEDALELWRGDAIAARLIETLPNEATREGWEIQLGEKSAPERFEPPEQQQPSTAPRAAPAAIAATSGAMQKRDGRRMDEDGGEYDDLEKEITKRLEEIGTLAALREVMCYERAFGGGAILLGANDYTTDLREPLELSRVRSLDWLTVLEPRELIPRWYYNNPRAPKFGQPAIYRLAPYSSGASIDTNYVAQNYEIHESRLLIFPGIRVSRRMVAPMGLGWGDSVLTRMATALRDYQLGHSSAAVLLSDFSQAVMKIKGLADLLAEDGQGALIQKLVSVDTMRSVARAILVDADGEDFERKPTPMSGFPETLDRLEKRLGTMCDIPLSLLTGESPSGLNANGNDQIRFFYDKVNSVRKLRLKPALVRLVEILIAASGKDPKAVAHDVKFPSLWQPTQKEIAEAHFIQAQADNLNITNSVVSPEEVAWSRFGGSEFSYDTSIDFDARADQEALVAPAVDADPTPPPPMLPVVESGPMPPGAAQPSNAAPPKETT